MTITKTKKDLTPVITERGSKFFKPSDMQLLLKLAILRELACGCSFGKVNSRYLHNKVISANLSDVGLFAYFEKSSWESGYWSVLDELIESGVVEWNTDMCTFTGEIEDWGIINLYGSTLLERLELPQFGRMLRNPMFPAKK